MVVFRFHWATVFSIMFILGVDSFFGFILCIVIVFAFFIKRTSENRQRGGRGQSSIIISVKRKKYHTWRYGIYLYKLFLQDVRIDT